YVTLLVAEFGAGSQADRTRAPSLMQFALHARGDDVLGILELLQDRAIGIGDRSGVHVADPEQVQRDTALGHRIGVVLQQFGANDAAIGCARSVDRVLERGVHPRTVAVLPAIVVAVLVVGFPAPAVAQFSLQARDPAKH